MSKQLDKPVSAFELFGKSYDLVMKNIKTFLVLMALPALAAVLQVSRYDAHSKIKSIDFFSGTMPAYAIVGIAGAGLILFLILAVIALIIQTMLTGLELEAAKGKQPSFKQLWELAKKYWLRLFGLSLVIGMYILGASLVGGLMIFILHNALGGFIGFLLIIAAILFVLTHYYLAPFAMIDKDFGIFAAMEKSTLISKQHVGAVLSVLGVAFLLSLTGILPIVGPIVSFVLGMFYSVAPALRYEELKKLTKA